MRPMELLSTLILLSCFVLVANKRVKSYIRTFQVQSALIALAAGILGFENLGSRGGIDLLIVCVLVVVLKVIYIPRLLGRTFAGVEYRVEKDFFYNIPLLVLACCGIVVFSHFSLAVLGDSLPADIGTYLVNSVSTLLIGLFFMISRRKAIGQIVGFLVIENGLFVTAMLSTDGMPMVVDLGIFIDLITGILVMGLLVFKISEQFDSIDINRLKKLRG